MVGRRQNSLRQTSSCAMISTMAMLVVAQTAAFVLPSAPISYTNYPDQFFSVEINTRSATRSKLNLLPGSRSATDSDGNDDEPRLRKRDIIRKKIKGSAAFSSALRPLRKDARTSSRLSLWNNKDNEKEKAEKTDNVSDVSNSNNKLNMSELWESCNARLDVMVEQFKDAVKKIPGVSPEFLDNLPEWMSKLRERLTWGLLSFFTGAVFAIGAIFIPIYNEVENLSEPVTLFETILSDLDRGYVDEVDTNKLFQTGVTAMLRSLDPYTEFEGKQEASDMTESITGKYGGVGLVISGSTKPPKTVASPVNAVQQEDGGEPGTSMQDGDVSSMGNDLEDYDEDDDMDIAEEDRTFRKKLTQIARDRGIRVVSAFEGYAFDYGMRVGDRLVSIDDTKITEDFTVEDVRNNLRGEPGTLVTISFLREGVPDVQSVTMPRSIVKIRDVKLATLLGDAKDGMGYIQLSGFTSNTGAEMRNAILSLQQAALEASQGERTLQGLVLDLRGNPGGLLTSAVDVSSLLVPKGSDIVSARGRGFPGVLYRSRVDPIIDYSKTKLAVLVNDRTASAAEIVSGAIQDLDVGVVVGTDRTFGKGLVQNVEELPFDTALKFTVAKYYTPSGRCIQGIQYKEGGGLNVENSRYKEKRVAEKDRGVYYTRLGRPVQDGGGVEADYKVAAPKASALEVTLLRSNLLEDFASQWSKTHELTSNFDVDDETYRDFQKFVSMKQQKGEIKLEALYNGPINDLKKVLKQSNYKGSEKELDRLKQSIVREVTKDFDIYKKDIKEDIAQQILSRYVPESMLIERSVKTDVQVKEAVKLLSNGNKFDRLLAKGSAGERTAEGSTAVANGDSAAKTTESAKLNMKW